MNQLVPIGSPTLLALVVAAGVLSTAAVQPAHVTAWIEASTRELAAHSVKQRLAALRYLFDCAPIFCTAKCAGIQVLKF